MRVRLAALLVVTLLGCTEGWTDDPDSEADVGVARQVYLLLGQSNATGRGDATTAPYGEMAPVVAQAYCYKNNGGGSSAWKAPQPVANQFGIEMRFTRDMPIPVGIIKVSWSASNLAVDWDPAAPPAGKQCWLEISTLWGLRSADLAQSWRVAGYIWIQGESDAQDAAMAAAYGANLIAFITAIRGTYGDAPFYITELKSTFFGAWTAQVRAGQVAAVAALPRVYLIETDDLVLSDGTHYDNASLLTLGTRLQQAAMVEATMPVQAENNDYQRVLTQAANRAAGPYYYPSATGIDRLGMINASWFIQAVNAAVESQTFTVECSDDGATWIDVTLMVYDAVSNTGPGVASFVAGAGATTNFKLMLRQFQARYIRLLNTIAGAANNSAVVVYSDSGVV